MSYSDFKCKKTNRLIQSANPITQTLLAVKEAQSKEVFNHLTNPRTIYVQTRSGINLYDNLPNSITETLEILQLSRGDRASISRALPRSDYFRELASSLSLTKLLEHPVTLTDCKSIRNLNAYQADSLSRLHTYSSFQESMTATSEPHISKCCVQ